MEYYMAQSAGMGYGRNGVRNGYRTDAAPAYYTEGNTARNELAYEDDGLSYIPVQPSPDRGSVRPRTVKMTRGSVRPVRTASLRTQRNRAKALSTSLGFVLFLAVIMSAVIFFCVQYIRLKSEYTARIADVAVLEEELAQLKEDNDAVYAQVVSNVDLDQVKKIAVGRLGMKYPEDSQKQTYTTSEGTGFVRQYQDLPG